MKAKLQIFERVTYDHHIEVEADSEETLKEMYENAPVYFNDLDHVCDVLMQTGDIKIVDVCEDTGGQSEEIEIEGWYDMSK